MLHSLCTATNKTRRRSLSVFVTEKQTGEVDGAAGKHWPLHANFFWQEATVLNRFISERKQRDYRVNRKLQGQISLQKKSNILRSDWKRCGGHILQEYVENFCHSNFHSEGRKEGYANQEQHTWLRQVANQSITGLHLLLHLHQNICHFFLACFREGGDELDELLWNNQ